MKIQLLVNYDRAPKFRRRTLAVLIRQIIREERREADSINVVLVDDDYLLDVNRKFLNHDYKTDVISFDLSENKRIDGEIYISVDRAKVQARRYKVSLEREVLRLIVHGVLHLAGWDDKTRSQKLLMRKRENVFISARGGSASGRERLYGKRNRA
ncbi:MAG: rRNA maturation RNase YbeY [Bacteroidetes bacterium]|nr:rRNA maturation RNase YbeY [Bacteroidota bacterium]MCL5738538.1 rRNA maturation RNase YbeY [Bacteroidota bacterium]